MAGHKVDTYSYLLLLQVQGLFLIKLFLNFKNDCMLELKFKNCERLF